MRPLLSAARAAVTGLLLLACTDANAPRPVALGLVAVDSGFDFPVYVTAPPGDASRLIIVERRGRILLRKNGITQDSAFLNLTSRTSPSTGEYGIYSVAFHPHYATNRRFFVYYADLNGDSRLSEFTATTSLDHGVLASEKLVLAQDQDPNTVLYGGLVAFGPDGYLYLALGDSLTGDDITGLSSPAQDSASLHGKMLRLDVDHARPYSIPAGNPFVGRSGWRPEIWSLGFRNPWRWSFDRKTGELWTADVGEHQWEEIDREPAATGGRNYGWPIREGTQCYLPLNGCGSTGLTPPFYTYAHGTACSVAGGYVYRGSKMPSLQGTYFYGDYCGGWIRSFRASPTGRREEFDPIASPLINDNVVSFGEDAKGEIYVVMASGRIYRIEGIN
ncbi:MAG: PQQ-dependent sugar dehydrogenase [Gemmatimonadota bacterium]